MKKILFVWILVIMLVSCAEASENFDPIRQADLADGIVGYRMFHTHLEIGGTLTAELSEIIGKEIYRLCTMMNLPTKMMCDIGVRNWTRILPY